jgi:spore coat polysaccharide biosynthesis protein SpsF
MGAGQLVKPKVIAIIQARLTSKRLPGKVLLPLPFADGMPIISNIIEKLRRSNFIEKIIVATSNTKEQIKLVDFLKQSNQDYFAGDENDVLSRFRAIALRELPVCIVRITSDNPFIDIPILDDVIETHLKSHFDYTNTIGMPYGMNIEVFSGDSFLEMSGRVDLSDEDKEHVTYKYKHCNRYKIQSLRPLKELDYSFLRVTIDTREDYMRAALIYSDPNYSKIHGADLQNVLLFYEKFKFLFDQKSEA